MEGPQEGVGRVGDAGRSRELLPLVHGHWGGSRYQSHLRKKDCRKGRVFPGEDRGDQASRDLRALRPAASCPVPFLWGAAGCAFMVSWGPAGWGQMGTALAA